MKRLAIALLAVVLLAGCDWGLASGDQSPPTLSQAVESWAGANNAKTPGRLIGYGTATASYSTITTSDGQTYVRPNTFDYAAYEFDLKTTGTIRCTFINMKYDNPDQGWFVNH